MTHNLYSDGMAVDIIENEGLAYAVMHYTDGASFMHDDTGVLWDEAATALNNLVRHLKRSTGREID